MAFRPFFSPSSEITNQLMVRMGQRRARVLREAAEGVEGIEGECDFDELLSSVLAALEDESEQLAEQDWEDQRWLSNIMYHFMGRMAGRARREAERKFMTTQSADVTNTEIIDAMSTSLGLYESQDNAVLADLATEFSSWLGYEPDMSYPAGWGRIVRDHYDPEIIHLEAFKRDTSATTTETTFAPREWSRNEARAANATVSAAIEVDLDA
jgi:hypothetical protein